MYLHISNVCHTCLLPVTIHFATILKHRKKQCIDQAAQKPTCNWSIVYFIPLELEPGRWRLQSEQTPKCPSLFALCLFDIDEDSVKSISPSFFYFYLWRSCSVSLMLWEVLSHLKREFSHSYHSFFTVDQPDSEELRLLSRSTGLTLHLQRVDVGDGDDGGSDVPGQAQKGTGGHQDTYPEQIQVVATAFLPGTPDRLFVKLVVVWMCFWVIYISFSAIFHKGQQITNSNIQ